MLDRRKAFVFEYLRDFNGTKSAIRAGYSQKTAASIANTLLKEPEVKAAIQAALEEVELTSFRILGELSKIAYADMGDYGDVKPGGGFEPVAFENLPLGATKAIRKIKEKKKIIDDNVADVQCEYELHDKLKAIELIMKYKGMLKDKAEIKVEDVTQHAPVNLSYTQWHKLSEDEKTVYLATGTLPPDEPQ